MTATDAAGGALGLLPRTDIPEGGATGNDVTDGCDLYTPGSGQWAAAPRMSTPRWAAAAVVLQDGRVLVSGGAAASSKSAPPLDTAEELS